MQLNLVEDGPSGNINVTKVTSTLKRGSWKKKRMDAKKIVHRVKKGISTDKPKEQAPAPAAVPVKSQEEFKRNTKTAPIRPEATQAGFTSSIFTSNPEIPKVVEKKVVEIAPVSAFSNSKFSELGVHPVLSAHLEKLGVSVPTPVQSLSIPKLNSCLDQDIIIQAQTGSGKTYSFLLPILNQLITASAKLDKKLGQDYFSRSTGAFACILVPTRELAMQISAVLESLLKYTRNSADSEMANYCRHWIVSGIIVGGENKKSEKARLRKGMNIVVATPGRLLDHLKTTESFDVGNLRWLVLDEADNLLHLGFEETLREILQILNEKGNKAVTEGKRTKVANWPYQRQTILCSATIEGGIEKLAEESLRNPYFIKASPEEPTKEVKKEEDTNSGGISIPAQLQQHYLLCPAKLRLVTLIGLLRKITESGQKNCKVIVFFDTGDAVDWHFDSLHRVSESPDRDDEQELKLDPNEEIKPAEYSDLSKLRAGYESKDIPNTKLFKLHGSLQQSERQAVFNGFSPRTKDHSSILFCTDVAARGLDVPDVTHVIQYDPAADVRDYIHRIGRTARLGKVGYSYVFLLPSEVEYLDLLADYNCRLKEEELPEVLSTLIPLSTSQAGKKSKHKSYEVAATDVHMAFERYVHSTQANLLHAQKAFSSHIRAYTTHIASEKHIFHIRKLHLGHMAKAFCLREAPAVLQSKVGNLTKSIKEKINSSGGVSAGTMKRKAIQMAKTAMMSEFEDGDIAKLSKKQRK